MSDIILTLLSSDRIVFSFNVSWIVAALMAALVVRYRMTFSSPSADSKRLMMGIEWVAWGAVLHRGYWALWRWFRHHGDVQTAQWFVDNGPLTGLVIILVIVGYVFHVYPLLVHWKPKTWALWASAFYVAVWAAAYAFVGA